MAIDVQTAPTARPSRPGPEHPPRAESSRRADIQGLRAVAVLMVVVFHATLPLPGGYTGVDVFFVISGFVITRLLVRELGDTGRLNFSSFYARRARRLLPALALVTTLTVIGAAIIEAPLGAQQVTGAMGRATSLFLANVAAYRQPSGYFGTGTVANPLLHMWSLGVEEQFYLFFPLSLVVVWRLAVALGRPPKAALAMLVALVSAVSFVLCIRLTHSQPALAFYLLPTRAWEFGAGSLIALAELRLVRHARAWLGLAVGVVGMILLGVAGFALTSKTAFPGSAALVPVLGAGCVLIAGTMSTSGVTWVLSLRPLVWIGALSYSWYLWHWPLIVLARAVFPNSGWAPIVAAFASIVPAWLSLRWLENPIRRNPSLHGRRLVALAAVCIAVPLVFSQALVKLANDGWGSAAMREYDRTGAVNSLASHTGCLHDGEVTPPSITRCRWNVPHSKGLVMLVGDSHAGALSGAVVGEGNRLGYDVEIATGASCSFTPLSRLDTALVKNCGQMYAWVLHQATSSPKPKLVVMTHADWARVKGLAQDGVRAPLRTWVGGVTRSLQVVGSAQVPVLLVDDVPVINEQPVACRFGAVLALQCSAARSEVDHLQGPVRRAIDTAAARMPDVRTLNLDSLFCTRSTCSALQDGKLMYFDNQHLSAAGSRYVGPEVRGGMLAALQARPGGRS